HFTRSPPGGLKVEDILAMINADMVGRMRDDKVSVLGGESAAEWPELLGPLCKSQRIACGLGGDGYGPSDQTPFFAAGVPVIHFFTGAPFDDPKPSDTADKINGAGAAQIARVMAGAALAVADRPQRLTLRSVPSPAPRGDMRSFNASLGTVPDYAGPPQGQ